MKQRLETGEIGEKFGFRMEQHVRRALSRTTEFRWYHAERIVHNFNARLIAAAGVRIVVTTDAHSIRDFNYLRYAIDQARRAGLEKSMVLNHLDLGPAATCPEKISPLVMLAQSGSAGFLPKKRYDDFCTCFSSLRWLPA